MTDAVALAAIAAMAIPTMLMRIGGFWLMNRLPPSRRLRRMLEALPGAVVAATIVPILAREGLPAAVAMAAAGAVMLVKRNDLLALGAGLAAAAAVRAAGF